MIAGTFARLRSFDGGDTGFRRMHNHGRWAIVTLCAMVALIIYKLFLAAVPVDLPYDVPHRLLLAASAVAACMVGASVAILILDRRR